MVHTSFAVIPKWSSRIFTPPPLEVPWGTISSMSGTAWTTVARSLNASDQYGRKVVDTPSAVSMKITFCEFKRCVMKRSHYLVHQQHLFFFFLLFFVQSDLTVTSPWISWGIMKVSYALEGSLTSRVIECVLKL